VRPFLTRCAKASAFLSSSACSSSRAGIRRWWISSTAAICMTVGNVSLELCPILQWSFGWIGLLPPRVPVRAKLARPAMTSLAFMLLCVPDPVCQTASGNWSARVPSITSPAASMMALAVFSSIEPWARLACAAAFFWMPRARTIGAGIFSVPMSKFLRLRCVCAPQYASIGTSISPIESVSVRVSVILIAASLMVLIL
jgi:hypothetical protein